MRFSVGVGLTNACDLAGAHCYRDTAQIDELTLEQVNSVCDSLPIRSVNLGTGENGLHPRYAEIVDALARRDVKLSVTSNGFTLERSTDETLKKFSEVEVSIDFPTEREQDAFRGVGEHGTPPALLRCELTAVGYRQVDFTPLAPAGGYLAVFVPPATPPAPAAVVPCRQ